MYDIIFFTDVTDTITVHKAIGAYKLAYELRQHGFRCLVVDRLHTFTLEELKKIIELTVNDKTLFVAFSTTFLQNVNIKRNIDQPLVFSPLSGETFLPQGKEAEESLVNYVKSLNNKVKIVIGGTRAHPQVANRNIDYAIIGYGETATLNLANHLKHKDDLKFANKNLWGVTVIENKSTSDYDFVNSKMYWARSDVLNFKVLPFEVSRGCIFKCKFCSFPLNGKQNLDFIRTTENMIYELEKNYYEHGVSVYSILDDTFNDNKPKLISLLNAVKKLKFSPQFWAYNRLDLIAKNPETMDILYDIGIRGVQFGIETLNKRTGLIIGKGYDRKKQIQTIEKIRNKYDDKISLHGTFIVGLPEESVESVQNTFNSLINGNIPLHTWRFNGLTIAKTEKVAWNSEIGLDFKKFGYVEIDNDKNNLYINWKNNFMTYSYAVALAENFNLASMASDNFFTPNILGWGIYNLGVPIESLTKTKYKDIDFHTLEKKKDKFNMVHKNELFKILH